MTTDRPHRPLTADDYSRIQLLISALERIAVDREPEPLWEILADVHDQYGSDVMRTPLPDDERVGDEFAAREMHFARIVLESLARHGGLIPEHIGTGPRTICATPRCPHFAVLRHCPSCELDHLEGST